MEAGRESRVRGEVAACSRLLCRIDGYRDGSLICDAGQADQTIFTTPPVPLNAQGNADFSGTFATIPGTCTNPLFLIRIGPDLPGANQRWIATGAVRSFGGSDGDRDHSMGEHRHER